MIREQLVNFRERFIELSKCFIKLNTQFIVLEEQFPGLEDHFSRQITYPFRVMTQSDSGITSSALHLALSAGWLSA